MESGIEVPKQGGQDEKEDWQVTQVVTKQHMQRSLPAKAKDRAHDESVPKEAWQPTGH